MLKDLELEDITYQMVVKNYNVIINSKKSYDQPINSGIKPCEEISS